MLNKRRYFCTVSIQFLINHKIYAFLWCSYFYWYILAVFSRPLGSADSGKLGEIMFFFLFLFLKPPHLFSCSIHHTISGVSLPHNFAFIFPHCVHVCISSFFLAGTNQRSSEVRQRRGGVRLGGWGGKEGAQHVWECRKCILEQNL